MYTIRCPEEREHKASSSNVVYPTCGHLLAIIEDSVIYLRCPICKVFWKLNIIDGNNVEMQKVDKDTKLKLSSNIRVVL